MAAKGSTRLFTGLKGFITELTVLSFQEDFLVDVLNCDIDSDGSVTTRPGINTELDAVEVTEVSSGPSTTLTTGTMSNALLHHRETHTWRNVAGTAALVFEMVRLGEKLFFFRHGTPTSGNPVYAIDLSVVSGIVTNPTLLQDTPMSISEGNGRLFCANAGCNPFYLEYDKATEIVTAVALGLQVRDLEGVDDGLEVDARPSSLSDAHHYNLLNQGWPIGAITCASDANGNGTVSAAPIGYTRSKIGGYPSNADIAYFAKATSAQVPAAVDSFSPWVLLQGFTGNTEAPKGHFIYDLFNRQLTDYGLDDIYIGARPTAVTFYAGRAWWAGIDDQDLSGNIYFGQTNYDPKYAGRCYQAADPTAAEINDLVDTDGGVIPIQEMGAVISIHSIKQFLVILASNGVWTISGVDGSSFTATNVTVNKVSSVGAISTPNVVELDNALMFFSNSGIHAIIPDESSGGIVMREENLTENTIETYFRNIPVEARLNSVGCASIKEKRIYWGFNTRPEVDTLNFNEVLIFDLATSGFTKYSISQQDDIKVFGMFSIDNYVVESSSEYLTTTNGAVITETDGNTIITTAEATSIIEDDTPRIKFTLLVDKGTHDLAMTFAAIDSPYYADWFDREPVYYEHYFELGYNNMGNPSLVGAPVYVNSYFARDMDIPPAASLPSFSTNIDYTAEYYRVNQVYVQVLESL